MWEKLWKAICKLDSKIDDCCNSLGKYLTISDLENKNNGITKMYIDGVLVGTGGSTSVYDPNKSDSQIVVNAHGGVSAGTTAGSLRGLSYTEMFDLILFPYIAAWVSIQKALSLIISPLSLEYEVGESLNISTIASFHRGQITNGDGTVNINALVGSAFSYDFVVDGSAVDTNSNGSFNYNTIVSAGITEFMETVLHNAGSGTYHDSENVNQNNLDGKRIQDTISSNIILIEGKYLMYYGTGLIPVDSTEVKTLKKKFIENSGLTAATMRVPMGNLEYAIVVPVGTVIKVTLVESDADVTGLFDKSSINVVDGGSGMLDYDLYSYTASSGYVTDVDYLIEII